MAIGTCQSYFFYLKSSIPQTAMLYKRELYKFLFLIMAQLNDALNFQKYVCQLKLVRVILYFSFTAKIPQ